VVEDPGFNQRFDFRRFTDEDGGEVLEVRVWINPGGGVPPHVHPSMEERFTVKEGRAEFLAGRKWVGAGPGETVAVPPGTRHAYRNRKAMLPTSSATPARRRPFRSFWKTRPR